MAVSLKSGFSEELGCSGRSPAVFLTARLSVCLSGQQHLTVQTMQGGGLQLATTQGQQAIQVDQTLTLELPGQPGEKKRRMACTCPNCKDADKRFLPPFFCSSEYKS